MHNEICWPVGREIKMLPASSVNRGTRLLEMKRGLMDIDDIEWFRNPRMRHGVIWQDQELKARRFTGLCISGNR
ncbi:hypothetical protein [Phytopseudomonas daroniae]|uniref:hypothetical protein n=1 Tax=Phytopseudomonas daroniae TaxID=2487519 RepID=UPI00103855CD|nr:hypothetical protein [Pseudomonas daroniae]TBU76931.1 hypothetical protein DNK10_05185 [Pseudomonas daroniae]